MARSSILLPAAILLMGTTGCGILQPTQSDTIPTTAAQALAVESTREYAARRGIRLDAVVVEPPPKSNYASWAKCGKYVIGFNESYIERPDIYRYIPALAAHEVCHIYLKHNLPCGRVEPVKAEMDANTCAQELLR